VEASGLVNLVVAVDWGVGEGDGGFKEDIGCGFKDDAVDDFR
jgi:hypothetical protein